MDQSLSDTGLDIRETGLFEPRVPKAISIDDFVWALDEIGLMTTAEVDQFLTRFADADKPADSTRLGRELVADGKLTSYQAGAICQGKAKGLVIGRYLVQDKLGVGGMGMVFKAKHRRIKRVVALKILPPSVTDNPECVSRFHREAKAAAQLDHPNIVRAIDADEAGGMHFLVMEFVDGTNLSRLVKQRGPQPTLKTVDAMIQAARGLAVAHAGGIVHRDVKPSNLMIDAAGIVKLLDLGLALDISDISPDGGQLTGSNAMMGTVDYMSPEQAYDPRLADARSDIYSLGCTLYYLLTARPPYEGASLMQRLLGHREQPIPSIRASRPDVSAALDDLFKEMVAKDPNDRPRSMTDLIARLETCRATATQTAPATARPLLVFDDRKSAVGAASIPPKAASVRVDPAPLPRLPAPGFSAAESSGSGFRIEDKKNHIFSIHGADAIGFRRWIDLMRSRQSIPRGISVFDGGDRPLYAAVAVPNRERIVWDVMLHSDTIEFGKHAKTMALRGSTLGLFGGYATSIRNGAVSLFRQTTDTIAETIGLDLAALNVRLDRVEKARHRLICLAGYPTEADRRFAVVSSSVWIRPQRGEAELTVEKLKASVERARSDGFMPVSLSAYPIDDATKFAVVFDQVADRPWEVGFGLTHESLVNELERRLSRGFSPLVLCGYRQAAASVYVAVWIQGRPPRRF